MTRRTTRHSQDDLNQIALAKAHKFQRVAVESLLALGWRVNLVTASAKGNRVIVMRLASDSAVGCAVYADGSWARSPSKHNGTVKWDWDRCNRAAEATEPDQYVKDILNKQEKISA
jgi:hypothetical protein